MEILNLVVFSCSFSFLLASVALANVVLIGNNVTVSFADLEANFAPGVKGSGECGVLHLARPVNACSPLETRIAQVDDVGCSPFVLIVRGGCSFEDKVRQAQTAGFKAAVVYDNEDDDALVAMAGSSDGIKIHAVFVSRAAGEVLKSYAGLSNIELWIIPSFESSAWSIMAISFISLLAMSAVLATCFFVRRHRIRRERPRSSHVREFRVMSSRSVKAMPSAIFTSDLEDNCTSATCAICLEDYSVGEKLRILPCHHKFHALCVDSWLSTWRTFCPVCKRDARTSATDPPASEYTPLLSYSPASMGSDSVLSSFRSSVASSSALQIAQASSQRSLTAHFPSTYSDYPSISPNSRYMPVCIPSSSNASPSCLGLSTQHLHPLLHYSESAATLSPFASAQSLPGC